KMPKTVSAGAWNAVKKRGRYPVSSKEDRTYRGEVFASKTEMLRAIELMRSHDAGIIKDLKFQPAFEVYMHNQLLCTYTADSSYTVVKTGVPVIEEVK